MAKKKKKSFQRTVAESPRTRKKTRGEAITGETMKSHVAVEKGWDKYAKLRSKALKASVPSSVADDYEALERRRKAAKLPKSVYTKAGRKRLTDKFDKADATYWKASDKVWAQEKDIKALTALRRSPSATVGKAGKEMETRRRKKKDD
jgi:hypothetical protein